ncbi:MAG: hypothetical protein R3242_04440 [Akkermansiaceae bacterium]|nr:hypothetical protein [Akkermansiaceae bacterium]
MVNFAVEMAGLAVFSVYIKNMNKIIYFLALVLGVLSVWLISRSVNEESAEGAEKTEGSPSAKQVGPRAASGHAGSQVPASGPAVHPHETWAQSFDDHAFPTVVRDLVGQLKEEPTEAERELRWKLVELCREWGSRDLKRALRFIGGEDLEYERVRLDPPTVLAIAAIMGHAEKDAESAWVWMTRLFPERGHANHGGIYSGPSFQHPANRAAERLFASWWRESPAAAEAWLLEHGKTSPLGMEALRAALMQMDQVEDRVALLQRYLEEGGGKIDMRVMPAVSSHELSAVSEFLTEECAGIKFQGPTRGWLDVCAIEQPRESLRYVALAQSEEELEERYKDWAVGALTTDPALVIQTLDEQGHEHVLDKIGVRFFVGVALRRGSHDFWPLDEAEYEANLESNIAGQIRAAVQKSGFPQKRKAEFYEAIEEFAD